MGPGSTCKWGYNPYEQCYNLSHPFIFGHLSGPCVRRIDMISQGMHPLFYEAFNHSAVRIVELLGCVFFVNFGGVDVHSGNLGCCWAVKAYHVLFRRIFREHDAMGVPIIYVHSEKLYSEGVEF